MKRDTFEALELFGIYPTTTNTSKVPTQHKNFQFNFCEKISLEITCSMQILSLLVNYFTGIKLNYVLIKD